MAHSSSCAILTYHSIDDSGSVLSLSPQTFAAQMRILADVGVDVLSLGELERRASGKGAAGRAIAITFDDGFRNVYEQAFPVLRQYGFPATVFLVTDYCGGMNSWPSQPANIMRQHLLSWTQIKEMSQAGITFGSHTRTHAKLTEVSARTTEDELIGSKRAIENALGSPVETFAYPYGTYDEQVRELARKHFSLACATTLGFVRPESDRHALERLDMYYFQRAILMRHLFSPAVDGYVRARGIMRDLRSRFLSSGSG
jgi:peptidoglycan/xylan/chitin deacetylase (PgdA/CDA1 family)